MTKELKEKILEKYKKISDERREKIYNKYITNQPYPDMETFNKELYLLLSDIQQDLYREVKNLGNGKERVVDDISGVGGFSIIEFD